MHQSLVEGVPAQKRGQATLRFRNAWSAGTQERMRTAPQPAAASQRRSFGHSHKLESQVPLRAPLRVRFTIHCKLRQSTYILCAKA